MAVGGGFGGCWFSLVPGVGSWCVLVVSGGGYDDWFPGWFHFLWG